MSGLRFVQKLANSPWLCDAEHVEFLHGIFLRYLDRAATGQSLDVRAIERETGRSLENTRKVTVRDGVARIPVEGTIMRRASLFTEMSGGVSTEALMRDFHSAYNDPGVRSILFAFDSPGGEAHGVHELAQAIRTKRDAGEKRIEAYCDGLCASAAYWIASATERITADPTAALGSIGVVTSVKNPDAAGKKDRLEFWNSRSPKKRLDPNSYDGQATIQEYVDDMGDEFIRAVADNRGVSVGTVEEDFGQGFVLTGRKAVEARLADALGSEEEVMQRLSEQASIPARNGRRLKVASKAELEAMAVTETREESAENVLSRIRNMLGTPGKAAGSEAGTADVPQTEDEPERRNVKLEERDGVSVLVADSGETLEISAEDRDRLAAERDDERNSELIEENTRLRSELAEANERAEALAGENESTLAKWREGQVDRELDGFRADGVPPYLIDLAKPDLLAGGEAADRWRSVLAGAKNTVEYGERGSADAEAPTAQQEATDRAKEIVAAEKKEGRTVSLSAARAQVWEENPALAARHRSEQEEGSN